MAGVYDYNTNSNIFQSFIGVQENWKELIKDGSQNFAWGPWFDSLSTEVFPAGQGEFQQTGIYRNAMTAMTGLANWRDIQRSRAPGTNGASDTGHNACSEHEAQRVEFGSFEIMRNSGKVAEYKTDPICVEDVITQQKLEQQLAFSVKHLLKVYKENHITWHREQYIQSTMYSKRSFVMTTGGVGYGDGEGDVEGGIRWYYDPYVADAAGDTHMYYPAGATVSTLRWEYLEFQREYLGLAAPDGALQTKGSDNKLLVLGSKSDVMKMIRADEALRNDYHYADSQILMQDYTAFDSLRGIAIAEDIGQMRFDHGSVVTVAGSSVSDGSGGFLPAGEYVKCKRLNPERKGRALLQGFVTEVNPDFVKAPYRTLPVMIKNVLKCQVPQVITNLGSGIEFEGGPSYDGMFKWLVLRESEANPWGESGNFFARLKFYLDPQENFLNTVAFLYASCVIEPISLCADAGTSTSAVALEISVDDDIAAGGLSAADLSNGTVTVKLSSKIAAGVGTAVSVVGPDASGAIQGYVMDASDAPYYTIGFTSTEIAKIDDPAPVTSDATLADAFVAATTVQA